MIHKQKYPSNSIRPIAIATAFCLLASAGSISCKKKFRNYVDIEQINIDSSNNYRHIFKKTIEEEREKKAGTEKMNLKIEEKLSTY